MCDHIEWGPKSITARASRLPSETMWIIINRSSLDPPSEVLVDNSPFRQSGQSYALDFSIKAFVWFKIFTAFCHSRPAVNQLRIFGTVANDHIVQSASSSIGFVPGWNELVFPRPIELNYTRLVQFTYVVVIAIGFVPFIRFLWDSSIDHRLCPFSSHQVRATIASAPPPRTLVHTH